MLNIIMHNLLPIFSLKMLERCTGFGISVAGTS